MSDDEIRTLTRAIASGSPDAFGRFYERWFARTYALARSLTRRDESFCLDVVHDAMLRIARAMPVLEGEEDLNRWVARVVETAALDSLRRDARRQRRERRAAERRRDRPASDAYGSNASRTLDWGERLDWLGHLLAELSPTEQSLLVERFANGKTLSATGAAVGLSGDAAHGRLRRLIRRLRALAQEKFDETSR